MTESLAELLAREPWRLIHAQTTPEIDAINAQLDALRGKTSKRAEMRRNELKEKRSALRREKLARDLAEYQREVWGKCYLDN